MAQEENICPDCGANLNSLNHGISCTSDSERDGIHRKPVDPPYGQQPEDIF